jgi:hypothetical protein
MVSLGSVVREGAWRDTDGHNRTEERNGPIIDRKPALSSGLYRPLPDGVRLSR